jgi:hypothetical protein
MDIHVVWRNTGMSAEIAEDVHFPFRALLRVKWPDAARKQLSVRKVAKTFSFEITGNFSLA